MTGAAATIVVLVMLWACASAGASPIGYVYAGSPIGPNAEQALQRFQVAPSGVLTLERGIPTTNGRVGGVAYVKTEAGSYLYVYSTPAFASSEGTIDEFKVDTFNGEVTAIGSLAVKEICPEPGNRLFVFDEGGPGTNRVFSETCTTGGAYGVRQFNVSEGNGELIDKGSDLTDLESFSGMAVWEDQIGIAGNFAGQTQLYEGSITPTGEIDFGLPTGLKYGPLPSETQYGSVLAVGDGLTSIANVSPATKTDMTDRAIYTFGAGATYQLESSSVSAMAYGPSALIAGEYEGDTALETFGIGQVAAGSGLIDLGQPPTSISPGSALDPNFIETIYVLGSFVYVGIYRNHTVELLDEPEKDVRLMETPFVQKGAASSEPDITVSAMSGFLTGSPSGPGEGGGPPGIPATGGSAGSGGGASGKAPQPIGLSSAAVARLKSGFVKASVQCGLPCKVAGALAPIGAKAQSILSAPAGLPFKPVSLPGGAGATVVKLKFTRAQKKLAASLLARHGRAKAVVTVTEPPGGASPRSATIKLH